MLPRKYSFLAILIIAAIICVLPASAATCESLASVSLPHATVASAEAIPAGTFKLPGGRAGANGPRFDDLPSFCRVTATSKPSPDSDIKIEVWLPVVSSWTGKFQGTGNGCFGGAISYAQMADVLRNGNAAAATDTGHDSNIGCNPPGDGAFALGHPEKLEDFGERAYHEMTVDAKLLIPAFYGSAPKLSFLDLCGGGSREALSEVQRYPEDWDAVAAGGLDGYSTHHVIGQMWIWQAAHKTDASYIPPTKYPAIHQAALEACDALDGVKDGVIAEPSRCKFDPGVLECKSGDGPSCLTAPQVEAARAIYNAPSNPRTGEKLFGPLMPGSELGWGAVAGQNPFGYAIDFYRYAAFKDPAWDYRARPVNFDADVKLLDTPENHIVNARNPDVSKFLGRGGKLLLIGGWNDTAIAPFSNTSYFDALISKKMDRRFKDSIRFYMVPDMGHCPGKTGASAYDVDTFHVIQDWREKGKSPDPLIATHYVSGKEDRKVLVCRYPQVARYKGSGSTGDPANFACRLP